MIDVKNVNELRKLLERYRVKLSDNRDWIAARLVEIILEETKRIPGDVVAVPKEVLERVMAYTVVVAKIYKVLGDQRWYWELLKVAERVVKGDKSVIEKLRRKLKNRLQKIFLVPGEECLDYVKECQDILAMIIEDITKPETITSLTAEPHPYTYMEYIGKRESRYLAIAGKIREDMKIYVIVPVGEIARVVDLLTSFEAVEESKS